MSDHCSSELLGVSIALATYNGENHILQQLESLAAQTRLPTEIVITDDGSTDRTLEVAAAFALKAPFPVKIYKNETRHLFAANFLRAASLCSSPLIAFCDQDDVWNPKKLEVSVRFFQDPDVLLSAHASEVWDGEKVDGKLYPNFPQTKVHPALALDPFELVPGFVMILRRELLDLTPNDRRLRNIFSIGGVPKPMGHDQWVWFLATIFGKVATISEPLAFYRQHSANVVGAPKKSGSFHDLRLAVQDVAYGELAELEGDAVRLVQAVRSNQGLVLKNQSVDAVELFSKRQRYHLIRALIYDRRSNVLTRAGAFIRILISGGYRDDKAKYHLGRRAGLKDVLLGVTGFYLTGKHRA